MLTDLIHSGRIAITLCLLACAFLVVAGPRAEAEELAPAKWTDETRSTEISMGVLRAGLSKTRIKTLTLEAALKIALEQNPTLQAATDQTRQAKAHYLGSLATFLPDVGVAYNVSHYKGFVQTLSPTDMLYMNRNSFAPRLFFRFNLLQGGAQIFQAGYAKRTLKAQRLNQDAVAQEILQATALRYYELQRSLADFDVAQRQSRETQENLALCRARQAAGTGTELEVMQMESQRDEALAQQIEVQNDLERAALRLNELLVLPAFVDTMPVAEHEIHTLIPSAGTFETALQQAREQNPRIQALAQQLKGVEQLLKGARVTAILPAATAEFNVGGLGGNHEDLARTQNAAAGVTFTSRNMGMTGVADYQAIKARIATLRDELAARRNQLQRELSEANVTAQAKQNQLDILHQRLIVSEKARETALASLKEGQARALDLIQSQTVLNQVRHQINETVLAYNQAQVNLIASMGLVSVETLTWGLQTPVPQLSASKP